MSSEDSAVRGDHLSSSAQPRLRTGQLTSNQYGSVAGDDKAPSTTHDISRVSYHVKHVSDFAKQLEDVRPSSLVARRRDVLGLIMV